MLVQRKNLRAFIIIMVAVLFSFFVLELSSGYLAGLLLNVGLFLAVIVENGVSIVTLVALTFNMLLGAITVQYYTGSSYGLLSMDYVQLHLSTIVVVSVLYNLSLMIFSGIFNIPQNEKKVIGQNFSVVKSKLAILFANLVAVCFSFVAFPYMPFTNAGVNRFDMLLPGHAWNQLAVVALLFNLENFRRSKWVQLTFAFVVFWFISHGERADMAGLMFGLLFRYLMIQKRLKLRKLFPAVIGGLLLVYMFVAVGNWRISGSKTSFVQSITGIFTFSTVADVAYLYNASIDYFMSGVRTGGRLLLENLLKAIPFYQSKSDFTSLVNSIYPNAGGEPIVSSALIDFGLIGVLLQTFIDFALIRIILFKNSAFFQMEYILLLCSIPRMVWYGRSYIFSGTLIFIPVMYGCILILNRISQKKI